MILYVFNNYFPDDSGFSKRCQRQIDMLAEKEDVTVICRSKSQIASQREKYKHGQRNVKVITVSLATKMLESPNKYISGVYELYRNIQLFYAFAWTIIREVKLHIAKKNNIIICVVSSPMTLPLLTLVICKLFKISTTIIEFHDLEPEMAIHIKKLHTNNLILKIEYFLEKLLCTYFSKIIVTNTTQADILCARTSAKMGKIFVLPNSPSTIYNKEESSDIPMEYGITKDDFIVGYISTLSFEYTYSGVISFLKELKKVLPRNPHIKMLIVGGGEGLIKITEAVSELTLGKNVLVTGKVSTVEPILARIDIGIIPWESNPFTRTILPTKLFEYLVHEKPVIVPKFGAFMQVITDNKNGLFYATYTDAVEKIISLKEDMNKRSMIAKNGYQTYIQNYDLAQFREKFVSFVIL